jgi:hypothetical protein
MSFALDGQRQGMPALGVRCLSHLFVGISTHYFVTDDYIDRGLEGGDRAPGRQAWFGQQIRQGLEGAAARLRGDIRQDGAGGVSDAGGRLLVQIASSAEAGPVFDAR